MLSVSRSWTSFSFLLWVVSMFCYFNFCFNFVVLKIWKPWNVSRGLFLQSLAMTCVSSVLSLGVAGIDWWSEPLVKEPNQKKRMILYISLLVWECFVWKHLVNGEFRCEWLFNFIVVYCMLMRVIETHFLTHRKNDVLLVFPSY